MKLFDLNGRVAVITGGNGGPRKTLSREGDRGVQREHGGP
jgi:hypothetical protein